MEPKAGGSNPSGALGTERAWLREAIPDRRTLNRRSSEMGLESGDKSPSVLIPFTVVFDQ
jgi:hypothetical protein